MAVTVTTVSPTRKLTRKENVKLELNITVPTYDQLIDQLIDEASAAIERFCGWKLGFGRQVCSVTVPGFGDVILSTGLSALIAISSVLYNATDSITDYAIDDRDEGTLYRRLGWYWTAQTAIGLTGRQRWPGYQNPVPRSEEPLHTVAGTWGYILPAQNLLNVTTVSADTTDDSFNDSAGGFPALLKAGDVVETSGFADAANNGRHVATGTPTTSKIPVTANLTTAIAGSAVSLKFKNLPDMKSFDDVEKAAIETVKTWYARRATDSSIAEKHAGPMGLRYADPGVAADRNQSLPPLAAAILSRGWRRLAA